MEQGRPQWTGARVARVEDARLLSGRARYLDDLPLPGCLEVAFVRSPHAHARIRRIDTRLAQAMPGVVAVWTFSDCPVRLLQSGVYLVGQPTLADGEVRYVGEPVVAVFAADRYLAEDAAEAVEVDYEPLPAYVDLAAIVEHPEWTVHPPGDNRYVHREYATEGFDRVFAQAPHRLRVRFRTRRQTAVTLEPRGAAAVFDATSERLTFYASTQSPHRMRGDLAKFLGLSDHRVRVVVPEVGGGFGMKANTYPEDIVVAWAALRLGRPVRWVSDRMESLLADAHARDDIHDVEVAFDGEGRIWAIADHLMADGGAYPGYPFSGAVGETGLAAQVLTGPYDIPHLKTTIDCVFSHKTPLGAYRGVWGPIASFVQEGIVDRVARAVGKDPAEVRRLQLIDQFPYRNPAGLIYDPGSYRASMEQALKAIEYDRWREEQRRRWAEGRYLGIGISVFVEPSAMAASESGSIPYEAATLRMEPSGKVTASLGLGPTGQGHETTMAQLIADALGVAVEDVVVLHGDTDSAPLGGGTGGSRSATIGGGAALTAAERLAEKVRRVAAHLLEADYQDVVLAQGQAYVRGVPSRAVPLSEIARIAYTDVVRLGPEFEPGLEVTARYRPPLPMTFSNGTHVAVVEVDIETGLVKVLRYAVVNDCGTLINPQIVEGQIVGGVAQGVGSAFLEELVYSEDGQLTTTTLLDYRLPEATDVPPVEIQHLITPSAALGGMKGMGEGSLIAAPAALVGAVNDALAPFAVWFSEIPITPEAIVRAVRHRS